MAYSEAEYKVIFRGLDKGAADVIKKINNNANKLDGTLKKIASTRLGRAFSQLKLPVALTSGLAKFRSGIQAIDRAITRLRVKIRELSFRGMIKGAELAGRAIGVSLRRSFDTLKNFSFRGAAIGVAGLTASIYKLGTNAKDALERIDEIGDAAAAINISPTVLQTARSQFSKAGIEPGTLDMGLKTLQVALGKGLDGFDALHDVVVKALGKQAFTNLDKAVKNAQSTGIAYANIIETLNKAIFAKDKQGNLKVTPAEIAESLSPLFGRSGKSMLDIIRQGIRGLIDEFDMLTEAGAFPSPADFDKAAAFEKAQGKLAEAWTGFSLALGRPAFDPLINMTEKLSGTIRHIKDGVAKELTDVFTSLDVAFSAISDTNIESGVRRAISAIKSVFSFLKDQVSNPDSFFNAPWLDTKGSTSHAGKPAQKGKFTRIGDTIFAGIEIVLTAIKDAIVAGFSSVVTAIENINFRSLLGLGPAPKPRTTAEVLQGGIESAKSGWKRLIDEAQKPKPLNKVAEQIQPGLSAPSPALLSEAAGNIVDGLRAAKEKLDAENAKQAGGNENAKNAIDNLANAANNAAAKLNAIQNLKVQSGSLFATPGNGGTRSRSPGPAPMPRYNPPSTVDTGPGFLGGGV